MTPALIDAWRRSPFSRFPAIHTTHTSLTRADLPTTLDRHTIHLVGTPAKWALLACPCGTGHTITLNLQHPNATRWTLTNRTPPTISPSIDVQDPNGRCHFWLTNGRVHWVQPPRHKPTPPRTSTI